MLVLLETSAGYAIFKMLNDKRMSETDDLFSDFKTASAASNLVQLCQFSRFDDITEALAATTAIIEGRLSKKLKKTLKKLFKPSEMHEEMLAVTDSKLGTAIKEKLGISCLSNSSVQELVRGIRSQLEALVPEVNVKEMTAMQLGLAHSLSRYKLKFSPDKIDTMIVQAISLLDDLDKETNNYVMRVKEMYGWHFPEMAKIIQDNQAYIKVLRMLGHRENITSIDLSSVLPEDVIDEVRAAGLVSLGTEITDEDLEAVYSICEQVTEMTEYRAQLYDYIRNRMSAIAPNLTILVGELVGARLISHAGTLLSLAKHPSSTVQILGAEKALFRALKTKQQTPKYGLLYHASLVGQANTKVKGKISRMLAAKASLAIRVDALGEETTSDMGLNNRAYLERRLKALEEGHTGRISGTGKFRAKQEKFVPNFGPSGAGYDPTGDSNIHKRKFNDSQEDPDQMASKKPKIEVVAEDDTNGETETPAKKKKKKKSADETAEEVEVKEEEPVTAEKSRKKKKKAKDAAEESTEVIEMLDDVEVAEEPSTLEKSKKKKKRKSKVDGDE